MTDGIPGLTVDLGCFSIDELESLLEVVQQLRLQLTGLISAIANRLHDEERRMTSAKTTIELQRLHWSPKRCEQFLMERYGQRVRASPTYNS